MAGMKGERGAEGGDTLHNLAPFQHLLRNPPPPCYALQVTGVPVGVGPAQAALPAPSPRPPAAQEPRGCPSRRACAATTRQGGPTASARRRAGCLGSLAHGSLSCQACACRSSKQQQRRRRQRSWGLGLGGPSCAARPQPGPCGAHPEPRSGSLPVAPAGPARVLATAGAGFSRPYSAGHLPLPEPNP